MSDERGPALATTRTGAEAALDSGDRKRKYLARVQRTLLWQGNCILGNHLTPMPNEDDGAAGERVSVLHQLVEYEKNYDVFY